MGWILNQQSKYGLPEGLSSGSKSFLERNLLMTALMNMNMIWKYLPVIKMSELSQKISHWRNSSIFLRATFNCTGYAMTFTYYVYLSFNSIMYQDRYNWRTRFSPTNVKFDIIFVSRDSVILDFNISGAVYCRSFWLILGISITYVFLMVLWTYQMHRKIWMYNYR